MAMAAGDEAGKMERLEVKVEVQHSAEKVWQAYVHELPTTLPAAMPGHFDELVYLDGPPLTPGSTFMATYHADVPHYDFVKFRWDEMDHDQRRFKCTLIDGGALNRHFSHLAYSLSITPSASPDPSCVLHFVVEYVDMEQHTFHGFIAEELEKFCHSLNSHLAKDAA